MVASVALLMALTAPPADDSVNQTAARARLVVVAPAQCLARDDLARRVEARAPHVRFGNDGPIVATVTVTGRRRDAVVVELELERQETGAKPRRIVARSCAEAADAVALILAVTLDPTARGIPAARAVDEPQAATEGGAPSAPGPPVDDTRLAAPAPSAAPAPAATRIPPSSLRGPRQPPPPIKQTAATRPPAPEPPPTAPSPPPIPSPAPRKLPVAATAPVGGKPPEPEGRPLELAGTVAANTMFGAAPDVMPGFSLSLMLGMAAERVWAPAVVLGWTHAWRSGIAEASGTASFVLDAGTLDACPLRLTWSLLVVRPCASLLVGRLSTRGSGTTQDGRSARPFSAAGITLHAGLGRTIELAARLGLNVTLIRDSYAFGDRVFYRAGALTTSASLGIGFRWP